MAGTILTPTTIWKDFEISIPSAQKVDEKNEGKILTERIFIDGKEEKGGKTQIFGVLTRNADGKKAPAILFLRDFENSGDDALVLEFVKRGYSVLSIDLEGKTDDSEYFTVYPECVNYANYSVAKESLDKVEKEATDTCWYEWVCNARYALKYLSSLPFVTKVGGLGMGEAATVMWQVAGCDKNLSCAVFVLNAGWKGYRGIHKFAGNVEPQFSDNMYKYIAGIEPQAYAMHVSCPTLMLSATNSDKYDCDRASDTIARISDGVFKSLHYSVGYRERVSGEAFRVANIFLEEFLKKNTGKLKADVDIACEIKNKKIEIFVSVDGDVKGVELYASEEIHNPAKRCWQMVCGGKKVDGGYVFEYSPYHKSSQASFFAQVTYKNGFVAGTKIINKKFTEKEVLPSHKCKILYSSRTCGAESIFSAAHQFTDTKTQVNIEDKKRIEVKKGPLGIEGVSCEWGLLTFKFATAKDRPIDGSILIIDVYAPTNGTFTVKLISDYFGAKIEYLASVNLLGGDVWQNVKFEINKFKTAEGMGLRSYDKIEAIEFTSDVEFIINNALWV